MSNKQVVMIFVAGIALLLVAFWAGLSVRKGDAISNQAESPRNRTAGASVQQQAQDGAARDARYLVVVATFGTEEQASEMTVSLRRKFRYQSAYVQKPEPGEMLYRVMIGPYETRDDAEQVQNELVAEGHKGVKVSERPAKN